MKTREDRHLELKRLAALPNGTDQLQAILSGSLIPFAKLPIGTLLINAILEHEYPAGETPPAVLSHVEPRSVPA